MLTVIPLEPFRNTIKPKQKERRCCFKVDSFGSGHWENPKPKQCARHALYLIDGVELCSQHAGLVCLEDAIKSTKREITGVEI